MAAIRTILGVALALFCVALSAQRARAQTNEEERRFRLAQGYERSGDLAAAARVYRELLDTDPLSDAYFDGVRRTYLALSRFADLLPLVESRLQRREAEYDLRVEYADLLFRTGRRPEAMQQWNRALESSGYQEFAFAIVASSQIDNRAFDAAIETYRAARVRLGSPEAFGDQLAQLYTMLGRHREAATEYVRLLIREPLRLSMTMGALAEITSRPEGAASVIDVVETALQRFPQSRPLLELLSWLYTEAGDDARALDVARRMDASLASHGSSVFAYADRALRSGRVDAAIAALELLTAEHGEESPLFGSAMLLYAGALEQRARQHAEGRQSGLEDAVKRYRDVARAAPGTPDGAHAITRAATILANDLARPDDAMELLEESALEDAPPGIAAQALLLRGDLYMIAGDLDQAERAYRDVQAIRTEGLEDVREATQDAALHLAEIRLYQGRIKEGVDALTELTRDPASSLANDALALLFLLQENVDRNDSALRAFLDGRFLATQGRHAHAAERFELAARISMRVSLKEEARCNAALSRRANGQYREAVGGLLSLQADYPNGLTADRALFSAAEIRRLELGDEQGARELYLRLITEYPRSPYAAQSRAQLRD